MLLVFGRYAFGESFGGVESRIKSVDEFFGDHERTYIDIRANTAEVAESKVSEKITAVRCHLLSHLPYILRQALKADLIYCHTLGYAFRILPLMLFKKVIVDFHGAGPEEALEIKGSKLRAAVLTVLEYLTVHLSYRAVVVSEELFSIFQRKYNLSRNKVLIIPILPAPRKDEDETDDRRYIIYSGSLHKWQMIDEMLDAIRLTKCQMPVMILTGEPGEMKKKLTAVERKDIEVRCVPREELEGYYQKALLGFVLRQDSAVNRVACPTKLVEYIDNGIVPITYSKKIGDFEQITSVNVDSFKRGDIPKEETLAAMRIENRKILQEVYQRGQHNILALKETIRSLVQKAH